jgi:hypothetical protein
LLTNRRGVSGASAAAMMREMSEQRSAARAQATCSCHCAPVVTGMSGTWNFGKSPGFGRVLARVSRAVIHGEGNGFSCPA